MSAFQVLRPQNSLSGDNFWNSNVRRDSVKTHLMKYIPAVAATFCGLLLLSATSRAQNLYVGSNAANVTTNFTSGTNAFNSTRKERQ